jgi:hypothetical protein
MPTPRRTLWSPSIRLVLLLGSLIPGCAVDADGDRDRADEFPAGCATDKEMVATARAQLIADEAFGADEFSDDNSGVESITDLNGDGLKDAMVFPGALFAGSTVQIEIYLTEPSRDQSAEAPSCPTRYAGGFAAGVADATQDGGTSMCGVRDLSATSVGQAGCVQLTSHFTFDCKLGRYTEVEDDQTSVNLCDDPDGGTEGVPDAGSEG